MEPNSQKPNDEPAVLAKNSGGKIQLALAAVGWVVTAPSAVFVGRIAWESTVLTWRDGLQMVGYGMAHSWGIPLMMVFATGVVWLAIALLYMAVKRTFGGMALKTAVVAYGMCLAVSSISYDTWQLIFSGQLAESDHAGGFLAGAAATGNQPLLEALIEQGVPLEATSLYGKTALHHAAQAGQIDAIVYLVDQGADIDAINAHGDSVLKSALEGEQLGAVALLRGYGAALVIGSSQQHDAADDAFLQQSMATLDRKLSTTSDSEYLDLSEALALAPTSLVPAPQNLETEYAVQIEKAETGDLDAMFEVGAAYASAATDSHEENTKAVYWLKRAAEGGHVWAQNEIGLIYQRAYYGETRDMKKAINWFQKAAKAGDETANFNLGIMYRDGKGVDRNEEQAFHHFLAAAEQGYAAASYRVSLRYLEGGGTERNAALSVEYATAAKTANYTASNFLRDEFSLGDDELYFSGSLVQKLFFQNLYGGAGKDSKELNWGEAFLSFADYLAQEEDLAKIVGLTGPETETAENRYSSLLADLLLSSNNSVIFDKDKAIFELTKISALHGHAKAQFRLATLYKNGAGVEAREVEAGYWFRRAKRQGFDEEDRSSL